MDDLINIRKIYPLLILLLILAVSVSVYVITSCAPEKKYPEGEVDTYWMIKRPGYYSKELDCWYTYDFYEWHATAGEPDYWEPRKEEDGSWKLEY
jgi:hypothetical protein